MICRNSPAAIERRAVFRAWLADHPRVIGYQNRVRAWLAGQNMAIPLPEGSDLPAGVLSRLYDAMGGKCVYCERPIASVAEAWLNLYRPPFGAKQVRDGPVSDHDCYVWLRWDADNMLLTCLECADIKGSFFPVGGPRATRDRAAELRAERPLILDPFDAEVNPLQHLAFDESSGEVHAVEIDGAPSARGRQTIAALDLNRENLAGARRQAAQELRARWDAIERASAAERRALLEAELPRLLAACADDARFAGMHRQLLWRWVEASRIIRGRALQDFRAALARWNGAEAALDDPDAPQAAALGRLREEFAALIERHRLAPAARGLKTRQREAVQYRQKIAALKQALRERGLPVDDLPIDEAPLRPPLPRQAIFGTDVLLVTVTQVEAEAVIAVARDRLGLTPAVRFIDAKVYHYLGVIGGAHVVMVQSQMGTARPGGATLTIHEGIEQLRPRVVIMVGIAFGMGGKQRIGDIMVAEELLCYELQRVGTGSSGETTVTVRGARPSASPMMVNGLRAAMLSWDGAPVHFGLVLSGDKLIDNIDYRTQLQQSAPDAIGGEMEGAGLYAAAEHNRVDWILVKAICDWADGKKRVRKEHRQKTAATNAAAFVMHVLQQGGFAV